MAFEKTLLKFVESVVNSNVITQ